MYNGVVSFLRNAFQDRFRRFLIICLVVLGIVLIVRSQHGAEPIPVVPDQPPSIEALVITKERYGHCYLIQEDALKYKVGREQKYDIECIASHPEGFALKYEWECTDGEISENCADGSGITWTAPNRSNPNVAVTVTVSDVGNNMMSESITLNVVSCSACTFRGC